MPPFEVVDIFIDYVIKTVSTVFYLQRASRFPVACCGLLVAVTVMLSVEPLNAQPLTFIEYTRFQTVSNFTTP